MTHSSTSFRPSTTWSTLLLRDAGSAPRRFDPSTPLHEQVLIRSTGTPSSCWLFQGAHDDSGYGCVRFKQTNYRVHVVMYKAAFGDIPDGLHLDHLCRVRDCCNPDHLEAVTLTENSYARSRWVGNGLPRTTHCRRGHEWTEENTYLRPDGDGRQCRACIEIRWRHQAEMARGG